MMLIATTVFSADRYVSRDLLYFWDFENKESWRIDKKLGAEAFTQGKIRWIPPERSFQNPESGVIHLHGDKNTTTLFQIPAKYTDREFKDWTLDFEFGIGTHSVDPDENERDQGQIVDGIVVEWGDLKVTYFKDGENEFRGIVEVEYRQRIVRIRNVRAFDFQHMVLRSEDNGVSVWINTQCVRVIHTPRTPVRSQLIKFASDGYAGRLDDIKLYNTRLKPWEVTYNYWGNELRVDLKNLLVTSWAEVKRQRIKN